MRIILIVSIFFIPYTAKGDVFLYASDADIKDVLILLSQATGKNIIVSPEITGKISLRLKTDFARILKILESTAELSFRESDGNIITIPKSKFRSSRIVKLRFYPPKNIAEAIAQIGVKSSMIHTNILFLEGEEEKLQVAEKIIQEIDRIPRQVIIEAQIVELTKKGALELGNLMKAISGDFEGGFDFLSGKANIKVSTGKIEYIIGFLEQKGEAKILSSPKILTTEGEKAEIRQGISVPYDVSTQFALNTVFYDAFLSLEVVPKISDNKIVLETKISKNFPSFEVVSSRGVPSISKNEITSKIILNQGESVSIGGIMIESNSKSYEGVPIISSIPVLGFLFKNYNTKNETREITVFLKPSIVD